MILKRILLTSCVCLASLPVCAQDSLVLVREGEPASVILLADRSTKTARRAAKELQTWLWRISGARLSIQAESDYKEESGQVPILVGDTGQTARLGLRSADFDLEELRIRTFPGCLVLLGDDERPDGLRLEGTLWAVMTFLEQELGVRYLWPGELGRVVPRRKTVEVGPIHTRFAPRLRQRRIRNLGYSDRIQRGLDRLGWSRETFEEHHAGAASWFDFHRIGGSFRGSYGHAFGDYWQRFHEDHPDWFALQPDGTRDNSRADGGHRARLCVSNRGLIEQVAKDCIERMRRSPQLDTVSISPNDGSGGATFCQCTACRAWDAPEGRKIELRDPRGGSFEHASLSDRFVRFYSAVAGITAGEEPERSLGAYAYSVYKLPPVHAELHPNVVVGFVPPPNTYLNQHARREMLESWQGWSRAARKLFLRPNFLRAGFGCPVVYVHRLAEDIRFFADNGMLVTDFDCCAQHWATDGLNYYVLAKILWNPAADVDAIITDYCRAGFGPASDPVKRYFTLLEELTTGVAEAGRYEGRKKNHELLAGRYTDSFLERCRELLGHAKELAGPDEQISLRIGFLEKAVEYARIRRDWALAKAAVRGGDRDARARLRDAEAARNAWYQRVGPSWVLNAPQLQFYGY